MPKGWLNRKVIIWFSAITASLVLLSSIIPFFTHWTTWHEKAKAAQNFLATDVCTQADTRSKVGDFSSACNDARIILSVPPVVRAFLSTLSDWNICREDRCLLTVVAMFENMGRYILLGIVIAIVLGLFFGVRYSRHNDPLLPQNYVYYHPPPAHRSSARVELLTDKED